MSALGKEGLDRKTNHQGLMKAKTEEISAAQQKMGGEAAALEEQKRIAEAQNREA